MSCELLARHAPTDEVCFGERGPRDRAQLVAFAERIGGELGALPADARVVLVCRDRYFFSAAMLACLAEGRVMLLPDSGRPEVLASLRAQAAVGAVLTDADDCEGVDVRLLEDPDARSARPFASAIGLNDIAFVAYTSGSTGAPQPHEKSLGQLTLEAGNHVHEFALGARRVLSAVPAQHIYGLLFGIMAPLLGGGSTLRETALFPAVLAELIARHAARVLVAVPAHLAGFAQLPDLHFPSLERVFSSAGPLPPATASLLRQHGLCVSEILGSTETGGIAHRSADGSPFLTMEKVSVSLDDEGVLLVSSPWLAPTGPRVVRTAERAELVPGGFRHLGRADTVVKVGGRRIDTQDVEAQLGRVAGVEAARVLAVDGGPARGVALWAVVAGQGVNQDQLKRALAARFEPATWPRRFRIVDALPRTDTGKVRRADLLALFE